MPGIVPSTSDVITELGPDRDDELGNEELKECAPKNQNYLCEYEYEDKIMY